MDMQVFPLLLPFLCSSITQVLAEYECFCSSNIAASVHVQPFDFSNVLGTIKLNDCKPTFPVGSTAGWRTIQFHGQVGYVSDTQGRVVKCTGTPSSGDIVHTPSPLKIPTTTTKPVVNSVHGNIQLCPKNVVQATNVSYIYQHGGYCYEMSARSDTWFIARDYCKNNGGSLVVIKNQDQQNFLVKMVVNVNMYMDVWIGLSAQPHSDYMWVTARFMSELVGTPEDRFSRVDAKTVHTGEKLTYTNWFGGGFADSFHGFEDCILLTGARHGHMGRWADVQCHGNILRPPTRYHWICQYNVTSSAGR